MGDAREEEVCPRGLWLGRGPVEGGGVVTHAGRVMETGDIEPGGEVRRREVVRGVVLGGLDAGVGEVGRRGPVFGG